MGEEGGLNIRPFATGAIGWKQVGAHVRHRGAHFDYANLVGSNSYIRDGNGRITMLVVSGGFVLFIYFIVFSLFSFRIFFFFFMRMHLRGITVYAHVLLLPDDSAS